MNFNQEYIISNNKLYRSHPVADIIRESSIFKLLEHLANGLLTIFYLSGRVYGYNNHIIIFI
jgi:hypothetical protein